MKKRGTWLLFFASSVAFAAYKLNFELQNTGEKKQIGAVTISEDKPGTVVLGNRSIRLTPELEEQNLIKIKAEVIEKDSTGREKIISTPSVMANMGYATELRQEDKAQKLSYTLKITPTRVEK